MKALLLLICVLLAILSGHIGNLVLTTAQLPTPQDASSPLNEQDHFLEAVRSYTAENYRSFPIRLDASTTATMVTVEGTAVIWDTHYDGTIPMDRRQDWGQMVKADRAPLLCREVQGQLAVGLSYHFRYVDNAGHRGSYVISSADCPRPVSAVPMLAAAPEPTASKPVELSPSVRAPTAPAQAAPVAPRARASNPFLAASP